MVLAVLLAGDDRVEDGEKLFIFFAKRNVKIKIKIINKINKL